MDFMRLKVSSTCHRSRYASRICSALAAEAGRVVKTSVYWAFCRVSGPALFPLLLFFLQAALRPLDRLPALANRTGPSGDFFLAGIDPYRPLG